MVVRPENLESPDGLPAARLSAEELDRELATVRERNQVLEARLEQLNQSLIAGRREEALLEDLIALRRGEDPEKGRQPSRVEPVRAGPSSGVVEATINLLETERRPMHISELMLALREHNVPIPGSGQQANLISYLRRDSRIARPSRGVYGLREWGLEDAPPPKRRTKRRRTRTKTSKGRK